MDKTTLKDQILLGTVSECSENASLDCGGHLCADSYCQEEIYAQTIPLRNHTDFEHFHF
jgi:hypothetical protein